MDDTQLPASTIARGPGPRWFRILVAVVAVTYLIVLGLSNTGLKVSEWLPPVLRYFSQIACLFPDAAEFGIEYRVEAWSCSDRRWVELDYRPDFPMRSEDKENRFQRVGHFYRSNLPVMQALDAYLVERRNARAARGDDKGGKIGGIQIVGLRIPFPAPGQAVERFRWRPLSEYPHEYRKEWYRTGRTRRRERCGEDSP